MELDSTNRYLLEEARAGAPEGTVAVAEHQTAGRGRFGRSWIAPPGTSLLLSVLLRPDLPEHRLHLVPAALALAAGDACHAEAGFRPDLKWPNDLVVAGRKLAGVLAERASPRAVVAGIGINVKWTEPPEELVGVATTVSEVAGREVAGDALLTRLLDALGSLCGRWDEVADRYRGSCSTLGRPVRVELPQESFVGTARSLSEEGHLVVEVGTRERVVAAGDVVHLRSPEG